jgi:hypothetical protein
MWRNYATHGRLFLGWRSIAAPYLIGKVVHMMIIEPFTPRTPDPDKAPRPANAPSAASGQNRRPHTNSQQAQGYVPVAARLSLAVHRDYQK